MRLPVLHIVVYQGCATFITEGPNAIIRLDRELRLRFTQAV